MTKRRLDAISGKSVNQKNALTINYISHLYHFILSFIVIQKQYIVGMVKVIQSASRSNQ